MIDIEKLNSVDPNVRYGFTKELLNIGMSKPERLLPNYNDWVNLLNSENNIFKWTAIDIVGYLSGVAESEKIDLIIPKLLEFLHGGNLITCNHAIFALGLIAQNKPEHKERIISEFLEIQNDSYETTECKNIATGKVLLTFQILIKDIKHNPKALEFIRDALFNSRNATKKKAEQLIRKLNR